MTSRRFEKPGRHALVALVAAFMLAFTSCRSPEARAPDSDRRHPVEKPWTKAAIESHEVLWLEIPTQKRHGYMTGPVLASDENGEFLTTKDDPTVHIALADITVMDAVDMTQPVEPQTVLAVIAGGFVAFWGAVFYFLPAIAVFLILA